MPAPSFVLDWLFDGWSFGSSEGDRAAHGRKRIATTHPRATENTTTPIADDAMLVARIQQGDPDAFATLMAQYVDRLTRFAVRLVGSEDGADDIVQQVFVELWERRASWNPDRLRSYLFRAVRNRALNVHKADAVRGRYHSSVQAAAHAGTIDVVVPSPEDGILSAAEIQAAVDRLPERRRVAIRLRLEEEMSHAEIAEVLGLSPAASQSLVARAIADVRAMLWKD